MKLEWMAAAGRGPESGPVLLAAGSSAYWPFWLVCVAGVALLVIGLLALLLLSGKQDFPLTKRENLPFSRGKPNHSPGQRPEETQSELQFVRIGTHSRVKSTPLSENQWHTVGRAGDICLDPEDGNLADVHFQICLRGDALLVAAVEAETFVNGVPIRGVGTVSMQSGEQLRAGSYEYRLIVSSGKGSKHST